MSAPWAVSDTRPVYAVDQALLGHYCPSFYISNKIILLDRAVTVRVRLAQGWYAAEPDRSNSSSHGPSLTLDLILPSD